MKLLAVMLLAAAVANTSASDEDVVQREHVRITGDDLVLEACRDTSGGGAERGVASFAFRYRIGGGRRGADGRYTGKVTFSLGEVVITMPRSIAWPQMTAADRERAQALRDAIYHHEVGHVRIAEAVRDRLNMHEPVVAPDPFAFTAAADAIGRDGFDQFKSEERAYDALTDHGRAQRAAKEPLAGPNTVIRCS